MDNGVYDKKEKKEFINHSYFKPLVFSPVKEDFQSNPYFVFAENKKIIETLVNIVYFCYQFYCYHYHGYQLIKILVH